MIADPDSERTSRETSGNRALCFKGFLRHCGVPIDITGPNPADEKVGGAAGRPQAGRLAGSRAPKCTCSNFSLRTLFRRSATTFYIWAICCGGSGCASLLNRITISDGTIPDQPLYPFPVYPGIQTIIIKPDAVSELFGRSIGESFFCVWLFSGDVPLSLAVDTLLLPFDVYGAVTLDQRRADQKQRRQAEQRDHLIITPAGHKGA